MNATQKSYDELKSNLLSYGDKNSIKSLMFVGSALGDGVSTTAAGFAENLAAGSSDGIVLIDANFRDPNHYGRFQVDTNVPGLADILLDGREPMPVKIEESNLHVIPSGGSGPGRQALFDANRFGQLLEDMTARFDYVVIGAPPALSAPESLLIAKKVDAVIIVLRSGLTRREVAKKVKEKIEKAGGNITGVVLNRRKYYIPKKIYKLFFEY